jgi:ABC-type sugar transport system substrate-binding protein
MSRKIRCLAAALALALLAAGAAQARALHPGSSSPGFFDALWQWLARHALGLTAVWEKEGGSMDPNGRPLHPLAPPPTPNAGSDMDPNGRT